MSFFSGKMKSNYLIVSLSCIYLSLVFVTPWFHLHPEKDHEDVSGSHGHSHSKPFDSKSNDHDQKEQFEDQSIFEQHFPKTRTSPGFVLCQFKSANSKNLQITAFSIAIQTIVQTYPFYLKKLEIVATPSFPWEYYVQFATNLSPPQA